MSAEPTAGLPTLVHPLPDGLTEATAATAGQRFGARLVDNVVLFAMGAIAFTAYLGLESVSAAVAWVGAFAVVVGWGAVQGMLAAKHGQSVGKKLLKLRTVRLDGSEPGFFRAFFLRELLIQILGATRIFGVINGLMVFGKARRTAHDHALGTAVVDLRTAQPRNLDAAALSDVFS